MRADLPPGAPLAQLSHAARRVGAIWALKHQALPPEDTHTVVLAVPDEAALLEEHRRLTEAGLECVLVREPDLDGAATALGVLPMPREQPRRLLKHLRLYR